METLHTPVFILGLHRSGTSLLYEMLSKSGVWNYVSAWHVIEFDRIAESNIDVDQSQQALQRKFAELGLQTRGVDIVGISPHTREEYGFILDNHGLGFSLKPKNLSFFLHACEVIQRSHPQDLPLLLKNPWDFSKAHRIKELIPGARFVFIHRNPLHSISSLWRFTQRGIEQPMPYVAMLSRRYERLIASRWKLGMARFGLRHAADAYVAWLIRTAATRCREHLRHVSRIPAADRIDVRYEDLCEYPQETMQEVFSHFQVNAKNADYRGMIGERTSSADPIVLKQRQLIAKLMSEYLTTVGVELRMD